MIIKSISIKRKTNACFKKLVHYILDVKKDEPTQVLLSRFIRGEKSITNIIEQFTLNEQKRIHPRAKPVKLFHEIISFSKKDKGQKVELKKLTKIARAYAKKRAPNSMVLCSLHDEQDKQLHIHLLFAGCQINGLALRISKEEFKQAKLALESLQKELLPQLIHSYIDHNPTKKKSGSVMANIGSIKKISNLKKN